MTVQERGAGLGDIFTQNTLSAIKAVCQVLALGLCGRGGALGGRSGGVCVQEGGGGWGVGGTCSLQRVQQLEGHRRSHFSVQMFLSLHITVFGVEEELSS